MATLLHAESRRLYSWLWDSHISPKNSKWLQENLTDMDVKVKTMIKLLEEDADSFARRAEMFYKKRPELMKMVEDFYRAYRALAERYDHATVELRQAHRTMAEAFPNQIPFLPAEESPSSSLTETDPHTPEMPHSIRGLLELPDELQNDAVGLLSSHIEAVKRTGVNDEDSDVMTRKKGLKQLNEMFTFEAADRAMLAVRKGLKFHEEDMAQEGSRDHLKLEVVDKEDTDDKTRALQDEVSRLLIENQDLKTQSALESERVGKAEDEAESLRRALSQLQAEEEVARLRYQQCLERLSNLEAEISHRQEEVRKLKDEILMGAMNLHGAKEQCLLLDRENQSLRSEVDTLLLKTNMQQELTCEHKELKKLSICIQDEHLQRVEAEVALQSLQHSHSQSEEEKTALRLELQKGFQMLKDSELIRQGLEDEVLQIKEENHILNDQNLSSAVLINNLQDEISSLKEKIRKLEKEAGLAIQQKNSLLEDLSFLKEEKDELNRRCQDAVEQVETVSLYSTCLQSSVKDLQEENFKLKGICQKNDYQKVALLEKLEDMEKLSEKNMSLERSLSDANDSLQGLRETLKTSEESYQSLRNENLGLKEICQKNDDEKAALSDKLENMDKLSEKNMVLERSLSDKSIELQRLRETINTLEGSYQFVQDENLELKEICQKNSDEKQVLLEKLEKLEKKKILVEKSLSDTRVELDMMEATIKTLADSYQSLQDENLKLKEVCQKSDDEKLVLQEKLESMEKVLEKNMILESSLSDASAELQGLRATLKTVEESFHSIQDENLELKEIRQKSDDEKLFLLQKLEIMEKLSEKNILLEISLSETTAKFRGLEAELKTLEESFQSLQEEKSDIVTEKDALLSQVECITLNTEKLSEMNALLENSIAYKNVELEGLREKSNDLEECCQSLQDGNDSLLTEKNDLLAQVESYRQSMKDLEKRHSELENKHLVLVKDRELTLKYVDELQVFLNQGRQEHAKIKTECATLENRLHLLQKEAQWRNKDLEDEREKVIISEIEIFVLWSCVHDIKERNIFLSVECQKYVDASSRAKTVILELEKESFQQREKVNSLLEQCNNLKMVIHQVLEVLDISSDHGCLDRIGEQVCLPHILERIKGMKSNILEVEDENQLLIFEKSIKDTLLEKLRLDANDLKAENYTLERQLELRNKEFSVLHAENHELLEKNNQLILAEEAGIYREEALRNEMENQQGQISNLREAYLMLQNENYKLLEGNASLIRRVGDLKEENLILQEENEGVLGDAMTQANLSLIFESISAEKAVVLKALDDDFNCLCQFNSNLENGIREMVENMRIVEMENLHLKESIEELEEYKTRSLILEDELNMVRNINDQLNHQIEIGKNLLSHKEVTLLEVGHKLEATQSENAELRKEIEEGRTLEEHLECELQKKTNKVELWERENAELHREVEKHMNREEHLESELLKKINEAELLETQVVALYEDLQVSVFCASLFEAKSLELIAACKNLQEIAIIEKQRFENERGLIRSEVEDLKKQVSVLEGDNIGLKSETAAYLPLILSLKESVSSLELLALSPTKILVTGNEDLQDASMEVANQIEMGSQEPSEDHSNPAVAGVSKLHESDTKVQTVEKDASVEMAHQIEMSCPEPSEDHSVAEAAGVSELHELLTKVQAVEKVMLETLRLAMLESSNAKAKLEVVMEEIKELKLKSKSMPEDTETKKDVIILLPEIVGPCEDLELQRNDAEASQLKHGLTMKDIQLDHISDSSSHGNSSYGMGCRQNADAEDGMLELWETAEENFNFKPTRKLLASDRANKDVEAVAEDKSEYLSSESQPEKELEVYNPEVSSKAREPHREENVGIVERLASDASRLMNLQTGVKELKKKTEKSGKSNRPAGVEFDNVNRQLKEVEEAILQLVDVNRKLTKTAEDGSASASQTEESVGGMGNVRKQQLLEQARKSSEKIGRLELELQRIQFILLKVEEQHKSTGTMVVERKSKVLLRDYLYGDKSSQSKKKASGDRSSQSKKKASCCACIKPATTGE
ncbi:protein NETWORKED 1D-like protein isoform X1 [Cinnamomum micranthum f. kanehirae]|uniref:Protein NETWORKED 1D-like protein isoform X1 n=1 Tax=Cinnamomum micranthum f. kanehirae TaxID=337451 RepID=A0A443NUM9_9MAGN|nr:protein NETWORKED 1D-like protein isoform X1 [Cinnamomum micranthum f. kanehirae]